MDKSEVRRQMVVILAMHLIKECEQYRVGYKDFRLACPVRSRQSQ